MLKNITVIATVGLLSVSLFSTINIQGASKELLTNKKPAQELNKLIGDIKDKDPQKPESQKLTKDDKN